MATIPNSCYTEAMDIPDPADRELVHKLGRLVMLALVLCFISGSCSVRGHGFTRDYLGDLVDKVPNQRAQRGSNEPHPAPGPAGQLGADSE